MIDKIAIRPSWQQSTLTKVPDIQIGEVHLWCLPLALRDHERDQALTWLSDIQRDKYARRATPELKQAYLAGRYFLLQLLGSYTKSPPEKILLSYTRLNKPYLSEAATNLHFNFTDTAARGKTYGLFAFSRSGEVGVDIEALSRRSTFETIVAKRFSLAEQELVTLPDGSIDPELFLCIWTRKEASGKATGQGINFKMNERDLVDGHQASLSFFDESNQPWRLEQLRLSDELMGCLVYANHQPLELKAFNALDTDNTLIP